MTVLCPLCDATAPLSAAVTAADGRVLCSQSCADQHAERCATRRAK